MAAESFDNGAVYRRIAETGSMRSQSIDRGLLISSRPPEQEENILQAVGDDLGINIRQVALVSCISHSTCIRIICNEFKAFRSLITHHVVVCLLSFAYASFDRLTNLHNQLLWTDGIPMIQYCQVGPYVPPVRLTHSDLFRTHFQNCKIIYPS